MDNLKHDFEGVRPLPSTKKGTRNDIVSPPHIVTIALSLSNVLLAFSGYYGSHHLSSCYF